MTGREGLPAYWTGREPDEGVAAWVLRLQLLYRLTRLTAALDAASQDNG